MGDVILAQGVSKRFRTHAQRATSLKERLVARRTEASEDFWALRDIDLTIGSGTTVGLIGANGGGKSTLLKVLAGILQPTEGSVRVDGRIASLLELGAGFNGELTGRENVYLNASLLGLSRRETDALFDDIVEFSEIGEFIDNQVKHYSSGMYVRLGFAVAVHVDPDVLLVDEVLAVGDEHFQRKCIAKIQEFQTEGRTILFVSHSLDLVENLCTRGVVLDHGRVVFDGEPDYAAGTLRGLLGTDRPASEPEPVGGVMLTEVRVAGSLQEPSSRGAFTPGEPMVVRICFDVPEGQPPVSSADAVVMGAGDIPVWVMHHEFAEVPRPGSHELTFTVPAVPHLGGKFVPSVALNTADGTPMAVLRGALFRVDGTQRAGLLRVEHTATVAAGTRP